MRQLPQTGGHFGQRGVKFRPGMRSARSLEEMPMSLVSPGGEDLRQDGDVRGGQLPGQNRRKEPWCGCRCGAGMRR